MYETYTVCVGQKFSVLYPSPYILTKRCSDLHDHTERVYVFDTLQSLMLLQQQTCKSILEIMTTAATK